MSDNTEACVAWVKDGYVRKLRIRASVRELGGAAGAVYTSYDRLAVSPETSKVIPLESLEKFLSDAPGMEVTMDIQEMR